MPQRQIVFVTPTGLHARPAALFTQAAAASGHAVTITAKGGNAVDATSILLVMSLGVSQGDTVTLECEDVATLDSLAALLASDLDKAL